MHNMYLVHFKNKVKQCIRIGSIKKKAFGPILLVHSCNIIFYYLALECISPHGHFWLFSVSQ